MIKGNSTVSVIIPTYNRVSLLPLTIENVFKQSYSPIELVIIDDGSTDNTKQIVQDLFDQHKGAAYFWKENGGCASARNFGLDKSNGDYILFLDSDDLLEDGAVQNLVLRLEETGSDFVYSPSIEVFPGKREFINYPVAAGKPETLAVEHFCNTNVRNGSFLFTRNALNVVGKLDESLRFNEDSDFVQRLAIHCKASYLATPTVRVLNHDQSKSRNRIEVYKALLISSENNLRLNPEFVERLGTRAHHRINEIKIEMIKALITEKRFDEATLINESMTESLPFFLKSSLLLKSNMLLYLHQVCHKGFRKFSEFFK